MKTSFSYFRPNLLNRHLEFCLDGERKGHLTSGYNGTFTVLVSPVLRAFFFRLNKPFMNSVKMMNNTNTKRGLTDWTLLKRREEVLELKREKVINILFRSDSSCQWKCLNWKDLIFVFFWLSSSLLHYYYCYFLLLNANNKNDTSSDTSSRNITSHLGINDWTLVRTIIETTRNRKLDNPFWKRSSDRKLKLIGESSFLLKSLFN